MGCILTENWYWCLFVRIRSVTIQILICNKTKQKFWKENELSNIFDIVAESTALESRPRWGLLVLAGFGGEGAEGEGSFNAFKLRFLHRNQWVTVLLRFHKVALKNNENFRI